MLWPSTTLDMVSISYLRCGGTQSQSGGILRSSRSSGWTQWVCNTCLKTKANPRKLVVTSKNYRKSMVFVSTLVQTWPQAPTSVSSGLGSHLSMLCMCRIPHQFDGVFFMWQRSLGGSRMSTGLVSNLIFGCKIWASTVFLWPVTHGIITKLPAVRIRVTSNAKYRVSLKQI